MFAQNYRNGAMCHRPTSADGGVGAPSRRWLSPIAEKAPSMKLGAFAFVEARKLCKRLAWLD
jgi:hypothetical protein